MKLKTPTGRDKGGTEASAPASLPWDEVQRRCRVASRALAGHIASGGGRRVVALWGESGSGKTTLARMLVEALRYGGRGAETLSVDDYYLRPPARNHEWRMEALHERAGPPEVNLPLLEQHVIAFLAGAASVQAPYFDPAERVCRRHVDLSGVDFLVVEGTWAGWLEHASVRIFVDRPHTLTEAGRQARRKEHVDDTIRRVLEREHVLLQSRAGLADFVLDPELILRRARGEEA